MFSGACALLSHDGELIKAHALVSRDSELFEAHALMSRDDRWAAHVLLQCVNCRERCWWTTGRNTARTAFSLDNGTSARPATDCRSVSRRHYTTHRCSQLTPVPVSINEQIITLYQNNKIKQVESATKHRIRCPDVNCSS